MAFLEKRNGWFRVVFKFQGRRFAHALGTQDERTADAIRGGVDRTLLQIQQCLLTVPEGADPKDFILSGGQSKVATPTLSSVIVTSQGGSDSPTFQQFRDRYLDTLGVGSVEVSTLSTVEMHLKHLQKSLGDNFPIQDLTHDDLQNHILRRAKAKGRRHLKLSAVTIRKELATFRAAWNWGKSAGIVEGPFPNKGLKYPKTVEKPPFQTRAEIERQIARGGLSQLEQAELWECLFLNGQEIDELLAFVKENARQAWIYPMVCFAAHTGARRSELLRATTGDVDLEAACARIRERKRAHGKCTTRRVPLTPFLVGVLRDWLAKHPGGPTLFAQEPHVFQSSKKRQSALPITRDEAHDHFHRTIAGSKWAMMKGWHVLRHSFISLCVSRGVDPRVLRAWVGHTTAEMEARYTHLYPSTEKELITRVFG
jgi:integrase